MSQSSAKRYMSAAGSLNARVLIWDVDISLAPMKRDFATTIIEMWLVQCADLLTQATDSRG